MVKSLPIALSESFLSHHLKLTVATLCTSNRPAIRPASLILKCRRFRPNILNRKRLESNTLIHTTPRHISIIQPLNSGKDLPRPLFSNRASQPISGAIARERELSEHIANAIERCVEWAPNSSVWVPIPVRPRKAQSAVAGNEDILSGWNIDVLCIG